MLLDSDARHVNSNPTVSDLISQAENNSFGTALPIEPGAGGHPILPQICCCATPWRGAPVEILLASGNWVLDYQFTAGGEAKVQLTAGDADFLTGESLSENLPEKVALEIKLPLNLAPPEPAAVPADALETSPARSATSAVDEFQGKYYQWETYTIQPEDSLSQISQVTLGNSSEPYYTFIAQHNGIANPNLIYVGQQIEIPREVSAPSPGSGSAAGNAFEYNGKQYEWELYTVQPGDTLSEIALLRTGNASDYQLIVDYSGNHIENPSFIYPGEQIWVPKEVSEPQAGSDLDEPLVADGSTHPGDILKTVQTAWGAKNITVGAIDAGKNVNAILAAIRAFESGGQYGGFSGSTPGDSGAGSSIGAYQETYPQTYISIGNSVMETSATLDQFYQGDPLAQDVAAIGRLQGYGILDDINNSNLYDDEQRLNIAGSVVNAWGSWYSDADWSHSTPEQKSQYKLANSQAIYEALTV